MCLMSVFVYHLISMVTNIQHIAYSFFNSDI